MDGSPGFRVRESPVGGSRIAFSYMAIVVALAVAGMFTTIWFPLTDVFCGGNPNEACGLGWLLLGAALGLALGAAAAGYVLRLGWTWWLAFVASFAGLFTAGFLFGWPLPAQIGMILLAPLLAALATLGGEDVPDAQLWGVRGVSAAVLLAVILYVAL